jgi:hypothetical protein
VGEFASRRQNRENSRQASCLKKTRPPYIKAQTVLVRLRVMNSFLLGGTHRVTTAEGGYWEWLYVTEDLYFYANKWLFQE